MKSRFTILMVVLASLLFQAFAQAQQLLLEPQLAPSAELDSRVLAAVKVSHKPLSIKPSIRQHGWPWHSIAAAASLVVVCCLAFALAGRKAKDASHEENLQAAIPSMTLEYALADNELDGLEIALNALNLSAEATQTNAEEGVVGVRRLDYDIISLEMDRFYDL